MYIYLTSKHKLSYFSIPHYEIDLKGFRDQLLITTLYVYSKILKRQVPKKSIEDQDFQARVSYLYLKNLDIQNITQAETQKVLETVKSCHSL